MLRGLAAWDFDGMAVTGSAVLCQSSPKASPLMLPDDAKYSEYTPVATPLVHSAIIEAGSVSQHNRVVHAPSFDELLSFAESLLALPEHFIGPEDPSLDADAELSAIYDFPTVAAKKDLAELFADSMASLEIDPRYTDDSNLHVKRFFRIDADEMQLGIDPGEADTMDVIPSRRVISAPARMGNTLAEMISIQEVQIPAIHVPSNQHAEQIIEVPLALEVAVPEAAAFEAQSGTDPDVGMVALLTRVQEQIEEIHVPLIQHVAKIVEVPLALEVVVPEAAAIEA